MDVRDKCLDRFTTLVREAAAVKLTRQLIAALMLIAWLFAGVHVALEHGGQEIGEAVQHHDEGTPDDDDHHHHDLNTATVSQFTKSAEQKVFAPHWVPILEQFFAAFAVSVRQMNTLHERFVGWDSPPDERASGWLLVCQTALQVRGPSLAV